MPNLRRLLPLAAKGKSVCWLVLSAGNCFHGFHEFSLLAFPRLHRGIKNDLGAHAYFDFVLRRSLIIHDNFGVREVLYAVVGCLEKNSAVDEKETSQFVSLQFFYRNG